MASQPLSLSLPHSGRRVIDQSTSTGFVLFTVAATDNDQRGTPNAEVTFNLQNSSLPFAIDPVSGVLTVNGVLATETYDIVVVVSDNGSPRLSSNASFFVEVVPSNNFNPQFQPPFEFSFPENEVPNATVFQFTVTDDDTGPEGMVNLTLVPSTFSNHFRLEFSYEVDGTRGMLFLRSPFDRETVQNFTLTVEATDIGHEMFRKTNSTVLTAEVEDQNDNAPTFIDGPYSANVGENATGGFSFFQVTATDDDVGSNANLSFSLAEGSDFNNTFSIDPILGDVSVIGVLHRATRSSYVLTIVVTDLGGSPSGLSSNTTLSVTVIEVNDNSPIFDSDTPLNTTIPEDTNPGFVLLNVSVSDADTGPSGEVVLRLQQRGSVFRLEGYSLVLNQAVDFEVITHYLAQHSSVPMETDNLTTLSNTIGGMVPLCVIHFFSLFSDYSSWLPHGDNCSGRRRGSLIE